MSETKPDAAILFLPLLQDLSGWWQTARIEGVVIGGIAASLLGRPRATRDLDALVILDEERWSHFLEVARQFGFAPRLPDALEFAREVRGFAVRTGGYRASAANLHR